MYQYLKETGLVKNADKNLFIEAKSPVVALRSAGDGIPMPEKRLITGAAGFYLFDIKTASAD